MSLASANWFGPERARAWCRILAVLLAIWMLVWLATSHGGIDRAGEPMAADFVCYWAAAHLTAAGHALQAYNTDMLARAEHAAIHLDPKAFFGFYYPPTFLLLCLPLALVPYLAALLSFLAAGFVPLFLSLRRILPQRWAILPILTFPGMMVTAGTGQNGFFTAACFGWFTVLLDTRPLLAGASLGLLSVKPHLALLAPVALIFARRWRALAGAAAAVLGLAAISWLAFGTSVWLGFFDSLPLARRMLETALIDPSKLQSSFGAVRILQGSVATGYAVQAAASLLAATVLARVAMRRPGGAAEGAVLTASALVFSPYLTDYDLPCLAIPLVWVTAQAVHTGWRSWEKYGLLAAFVMPIVARGIAHRFGVPLAPLMLLSLLAIVARRVAPPAREALVAGAAH